ncbi:MAG: protein kinase [Planctomycetota bacterium]
MTSAPLPERFDRVEPLADTVLERRYRAFDRVLEREVIARLPAQVAWAAWSISVRERLLREARALARIQHDLVVPILWVEETADGPLVVQPLPDGELLRDRLQQGPLGIAEVTALGIDVARALAAVHYGGIVHRGVGLDAIWLRADGRARLGAFTFAKAFDARLPSSIDHARERGSEAAVALPPYPAPEQLAGRAADPRVDVWALGCVLYRCLCGQDPACGDGGAVADVRTHRRDVPRALAEVVRKCLQSAPTARFPTAQAVADALAATRPVPARGGARGVPLGIGLGALVLGALALWQPWGGPDPRGPAAPTAVLAAGDSTNGPYTDRYSGARALLIGIAERYRGGPYAPLAGPVNEVRAVAQRLKELAPGLFTDDTVTVLEEAREEDIRTELRRLIEGSKRDEALLVYFAGHGQRVPQSGGYWLAARDVEDLNPTIKTKGYIDSGALLDLGRAEAKHLLVVLDCCYGGQLVDSDRTRGREIDRADLDPRSLPYLSHKVRQLLASTGAETKAKDPKQGGVSEFCRAFLDALDPAKGTAAYVTAGMLEERIAQAMPDDQKPQLIELAGHQDAGRFVFFLR